MCQKRDHDGVRCCVKGCKRRRVERGVQETYVWQRWTWTSVQRSCSITHWSPHHLHSPAPWKNGRRAGRGDGGSLAARTRGDGGHSYDAEWSGTHPSRHGQAA